MGHINHVIDIASPEELFEHDGPLLAEDSEMYNFRRHAAIWRHPPEPSPETQVNGAELRAKRLEEQMQEHVKKVMEQIKARKEEEVLQRFDSAIRTAAHRVDLLDRVDTSEAHSSSAEQLVQDTMESLQAAQERIEIRARATAALQAATKRAAGIAAKAESAPKAEVKETSGPKVATKATVPQSKEPDCEPDKLQARIQKALKAAHSRRASEVAFQVGDVVEIVIVTESDSSALVGTRRKPGKVGKIIKSDGSSQPYCVELPGGQKVWCKKTWIEAVKVTQAVGKRASQILRQPAERPPVESAIRAEPGPSAGGATKHTKRSQEMETIQDRIARVMAETQRRTQTAQDTQGVHAGENLEEQTTTASSYSDENSGSENEAEWQPSLWWGPAPR